jgi:hypothetical protein
LSRTTSTVERGLCVQIQRDPVRRHGEGFEEPVDRFRGCHGRSSRPETPQVHVQLSVWEQVANLVSPVHGQRRFTDSGRPGDDRDDDGASGAAVLMR